LPKREALELARDGDALDRSRDAGSIQTHLQQCQYPTD
jgi:hypothetical protein